ncbi:hypothetical protein [Bradymonas sediminis]|uniref:Uncharacterized protein n=1 Tax=Bradymonas sediminis TaxID=1548548 RepID=A0A2Z4FKI3_9DELT|nr:hypothetical protein [Bradymonas sediminis]AWV89497.1 hypothetical protein DN745_09150 [Bradymonas sediminis]TDP76775.1 hypothetical protein DFR33_102412 [Bradymonas sediminis]
MKHPRPSNAAAAVLLTLLMLGACSDAYEQSGPSDIVLEGQLCSPSTPDCPRLKFLKRPNELGANRLDFRLSNHGAPATITVIAALESQDGEPDAGLADAGLTDAGDPGADPSDEPSGVTRSYQLARDESVSDRFVPEELLTVSTFALILDCDGCEATLDYVLATEPLECRIDNDCSSSWVCSRADGRCVECLADSDCSNTQTCDLGTQQCTPVDLGGCSSAPTSTPPVLPVAILLLFALGFKLTRTGHDRPGALFLLAAIATIGLSPAPAQAASPTASVQLGVGPRLLTGKLGDATLRGIGLKVSQEVRSQYVGGQLTLGTSYFVTTQDGPPLSNELQLYSVAIGPQFYLPLGPVEFALGGDFRHIGVVTNSLVRLTGPDLNYLGAGATLQARYQIGGLAVMLDSGFHPIFGLESSLFSMHISVGLATD